jgi:hypothetical protein
MKKQDVTDLKKSGSSSIYDRTAAFFEGPIDRSTVTSLAVELSKAKSLRE